MSFVGRFPPLPTPSTHGSWSKLTGRFTPNTCLATNINSKPREGRYKGGPGGITPSPNTYLYPRGSTLQYTPFLGVFGLKNGLHEIPQVSGFGKILSVVCEVYGTAQPHTPQSPLYPPSFVVNGYGNPFEIGWTKMAGSSTGCRTRGGGVPHPLPGTASNQPP